MLLRIPQVLTLEQVDQCRALLRQANWQDGKATAGPQAARVKNNHQVPADSPEAQQMAALIIQALQNNPLFMSAALPSKILPPKFSCYQNGQAYGAHVDNTVMRIESGEALRADVSATLFLTQPEEYQGGELIIHDSFGEQQIKLAAGDLLIYPSGSLHQVAPVTSGVRLVAFFWIQSLVRSAEQRRTLYELDGLAQQLRGELTAEHAGLTKLSGIYQNLLRQWMDS
ncbi:PKHD-type hydroxylase [Atopomonas hussainii]|uniref:PKHD-type hydroxylase n=1 Tax=Atopomonas hussainii TaxID=1429083 RepID=A0A1H7FR73_9GAMM|nr:Fe2+-dependent dioxygenase [Atopomonas hussainii]SEK28478.1 PKHD-type hydroxylase [Atopomonas hussainii]